MRGTRYTLPTFTTMKGGIRMLPEPIVVPGEKIYELITPAWMEADHHFVP